LTKILEKHELAPKITSFLIDAPRIARKAQPGQFVVVRLSDRGERIPLTIADYNREAGTICIVVHQIGKTTMELGRLEPGDSITDLLGPLGMPIETKYFGRVVCVAGGLGAAPIYPKAKALKAAGNEIVTILGAQTKEMLILSDELEAVSDEMYYATNDGTMGHKGFVTEPLAEYLAKGKQVDEVIAIGPVPMMNSVCKVTAAAHIPTMVSLNAVMIDGTGMCGGCRVTVDGEIKFSCVDGPAFDGHRVNFDELLVRQRYYQDQEKASMRDHLCKLGSGLGGS
jgi:ferredoxin--NADP+ reductase